MAKGAWNRTALLASLLAEPYRDRDEDPEPYTAADFHPFLPSARRRAETVIPYDPTILEHFQANL